MRWICCSCNCIICSAKTCVTCCPARVTSTSACAACADKKHACRQTHGAPQCLMHMTPAHPSLCMLLVASSRSLSTKAAAGWYHTTSWPSTTAASMGAASCHTGSPDTLLASFTMRCCCWPCCCCCPGPPAAATAFVGEFAELLLLLPPGASGLSMYRSPLASSIASRRSLAFPNCSRIAGVAQQGLSQLMLVAYMHAPGFNCCGRCQQVNVLNACTTYAVQVNTSTAAAHLAAI